MTMENGKEYVGPVLRKRADKAPVYCFYCVQCKKEADGYTITDIDTPGRPATLSVFCHGDRWQLGIDSMPSFREMMEPYLYRPHEAHPRFFSVFGQPQPLDI